MNNNLTIKKDNNLFKLRKKATELFRQSFFESNILNFNETFVANYFNNWYVKDIKHYIKTVEKLKTITAVHKNN